MKENWSIGIARFPYGGNERFEIGDWIISAHLWAKKNNIRMVDWHLNDTPITMCRNRAVKDAIANDIDILVMVDSDMGPDGEGGPPFLPTAFDFMRKRWHAAPTYIAAPYGGAPPDHTPMIGVFREQIMGEQWKAQLYSHEEAASFTGIQPAPYLGTGLVALDMRIFTGFEIKGEMVKLPPPWFYYEWTDEYHTAKAATEDMAFSLDCYMLFGKHGLAVNHCAWDCWANHYKTERVRRSVPRDHLAVAMQGRSVRPHTDKE